jgi:hypothetical protein
MVNRRSLTFEVLNRQKPPSDLPPQRRRRLPLAAPQPRRGTSLPNDAASPVFFKARQSARSSPPSTPGIANPCRQCCRSVPGAAPAPAVVRLAATPSPPPPRRPRQRQVPASRIHAVHAATPPPAIIGVAIRAAAPPPAVGGVAMAPLLPGLRCAARQQSITSEFFIIYSSPLCLLVF